LGKKPGQLEKRVLALIVRTKQTEHGYGVYEAKFITKKHPQLTQNTLLNLSE
jgi:hypothetical protein